MVATSTPELKRILDEVEDKQAKAAQKARRNQAKKQLQLDQEQSSSDSGGEDMVLAETDDDVAEESED